MCQEVDGTRRPLPLRMPRRSNFPTVIWRTRWNKFSANVWLLLLRFDVLRVFLPVLRSHLHSQGLIAIGFLSLWLFSLCYHSTIPSVDESLIQSMFGLYGIGWVGDFCVVLLVFLWFATHIVDFLIKLHLSLERYSDFRIFTSKMPRLYFELLHESVHLISRERLVISRERGVCCYADVRHIFQ